jgi:hypothetical protein
MDGPVDWVFIPCGHGGCEQCVKRFVRKPCFVCRKKVSKTMRIFC